MALLMNLFFVGMIILFVMVTFLVVRAIVKNPGSGGVQAIEGRVMELDIDENGTNRARLALSDGTQQVFTVTDSQAKVMTVGAIGTVHHTGDRLTGWVPQGAPIDQHRSE